MNKPTCKTCHEQHYNFQRCALEEVDVPDIVEPEAPVETEPQVTPPGSLKPWGKYTRGSTEFGPPVN